MADNIRITGQDTTDNKNLISFDVLQDDAVVFSSVFNFPRSYTADDIKYALGQLASNYIAGLSVTPESVTDSVGQTLAVADCLNIQTTTMKSLKKVVS